MRLDLVLFALAAPLAALGDLRHSGRRTHSEIAKRAEGSVQLHKRFDNARWTFYDVGGAAGACGQFNSPGQHIVALNSAQYGGGYPGPHCFKTIVMKIGDKQTTATITDECPGCPYGGLDLTRGLFEFFAPLGVGVLSGEWWFADEAPEPPKPKPEPPKPKTTSKPPPPPPTTTHHTTTSHTSTSSSTSSSTHSASTSINYSSGLPTPTSAVSTDGQQNVLDINQVLIGLGGLIIGANEVN